MNLIELKTKINKIEIKVELSNHSLKDGEIMKKDKIYQIIKTEFDRDLTFEERAQLILNALQPFCYQVSITPPAQGCSYYYTVIVRK